MASVRKNLLRWLIGAVAAGVAVGIYWLSARPAPTPRVATRSAGARLFAENRACAECHEEQSNGHQLTGHADTFRFTADSEVARQLDGKIFQDPERPYAFHYHFDEIEGLSVTIPELFGQDGLQLPYELGSGHNALTFLSLIPNQVGDVVGVEHRVSLYAGKSGIEMDLTPGHRQTAPKQTIEHFGNILRGDKLHRCVACHTTTADIVKRKIDNLRPNVGCQSCHGPGEQHVLAMRADERGEVIEGGDAIESGGYLGFTQRTALEEVQLCGKCHRLPDGGSEISPGNIRNVRFQSVGILQSSCFKESGGRLKCSTCHNPHRPVSRELEHYVNRCLSCHSETSPSASSGRNPEETTASQTPATLVCPVSPRKNCVSCHMPAIDVHRGIEFHDHWIRVRDDEPLAPPEE